MSKKVENQKNPQLFFVSYFITCDDEVMKHCEFLRTRWVRRLNITHSELCEELKFIEEWNHLKNSDGTQCVGDGLTARLWMLLERWVDESLAQQSISKGISW